jgi:hypothetical protein
MLMRAIDDDWVSRHVFHIVSPAAEDSPERHFFILLIDPTEGMPDFSVARGAAISFLNRPSDEVLLMAVRELATEFIVSYSSHPAVLPPDLRMIGFHGEA